MASDAGYFLRLAATAAAAAALVLLALLEAFSGAPPRAASAPASTFEWSPEPDPPEAEADAPPSPSVPTVAITAGERIQQALQSDDPQLRAQAWRLLRHCEFVLAPGSARPLVAPPAWMAWETVRRADQAWQASAQRCDSLRSLADRAALARRLDPVPSAVEERWLARNFHEHGGLALLWAGDALLAHVERRIAGADGDGLEPLDPEAVQIARCRFGEDCGPDSQAAQAACLTVGACEGDVPQRLLATLGSRAARERVQRKADALVEALQRGDLARYGLGE